MEGNINDINKVMEGLGDKLKGFGSMMDSLTKLTPASPPIKGTICVGIEKKFFGLIKIEKRVPATIIKQMNGAITIDFANTADAESFYNLAK